MHTNTINLNIRWVTVRVNDNFQWPTLETYVLYYKEKVDRNAQVWVLNRPPIAQILTARSPSVCLSLRSSRVIYNPCYTYLLLWPVLNLALISVTISVSFVPGYFWNCDFSRSVLHYSMCLSVLLQFSLYEFCIT